MFPDVRVDPHFAVGAGTINLSTSSRRCCPQLCVCPLQHVILSKELRALHEGDPQHWISDSPASRMAVESLIDFVRNYAANGNEAAVRHRRGYRMETWSYARIVQEASRLARELEFRGIVKGDAVLLWGENSPEWIVVFFGCLLRGAVVVPVDHGSTVEFASRIAREVNAKLLFRSRTLPDPGLPIQTVV